MHLNLVRFSDFGTISRYSALFGEDAVIVAGPGPAAGHVKGPALASSPGIIPCSILEGPGSAVPRKSADKGFVVAVRGSSPESCAWAANSKGVDLLLQPFSTEKCFLDIQTANVLRDRAVFVGVLFSDFLESDGFRQAQLFKNAAMCVKLCASAGTKILLLSGARSWQQMRASKDLSSFGVMLGMGKEDALRAVRGNAEEFAGRFT
ncbi:MAG: hypothetical protein HY544_04240 [Candidatus Diapherotrites archaeon]|uniref:Uncharacterized protein n=1 Tax=Candidatus Iainarchaeum sp. TaxID=3101447 RepID=A0A8T3YLX4_9ARCH|nr:hypothetical protein [Candidatus Diapherotrites archaeon]